MDDYLKQSLERGNKFEAMMTTEGWKLVEAYYLNVQADLANRMFTSDQPAVDFQHELDEIRGLRKLMISITHDVDILNEQRRPTTEQSDETTTD